MSLDVCLFMALYFNKDCVCVLKNYLDHLRSLLSGSMEQCTCHQVWQHNNSCLFFSIFLWFVALFQIENHEVRGWQKINLLPPQQSPDRYKVVCICIPMINKCNFKIVHEYFLEVSETAWRGEGKIRTRLFCSEGSPYDSWSSESIPL